MKKVVAINSSYRNNGYTRFLLEKIARGFEKQQVNFEIINLCDKNIKRCISCGTCHTQKSYLKCIFEDKDEVKQIFDKMRESDLVIYATPIYLAFRPC